LLETGQLFTKENTMPNHVTNRVTLAGPEAAIKKLKETVIVHHPTKQKGDEADGTLMFKTAGGKEQYGWTDAAGNFTTREDGKTVSLGLGVPPGWVPAMADPFDSFDFERIIPHPSVVFQGNLSTKDRDEKPGRNWMDWNCRKWGTKWNSYSFKQDEQGRILFDTAWAFPEPVFIELSHLFPEVTISVEVIDEGHNFWGDAMFLAGAKRIDRIVEYGEATEKDVECRKKLTKELRGYDEDADEDTEE
jgi:hypothetical protein